MRWVLALALAFVIAGCGRLQFDDATAAAITTCGAPPSSRDSVAGLEFRR